MVTGRIGLAVLLLFTTVGSAFAQDSPLPAANPGPDPQLAHRPDARPEMPDTVPPPEQIVSLTVPKGTPLQVVLDKEVKIAKVGQPIHGRLVEHRDVVVEQVGGLILVHRRKRYSEVIPEGIDDDHNSLVKGLVVPTTCLAPRWSYDAYTRTLVKRKNITG